MNRKYSHDKRNARRPYVEFIDIVAALGTMAVTSQPTSTAVIGALPAYASPIPFLLHHPTLAWSRPSPGDLTAAPPSG